MTTYKLADESANSIRAIAFGQDPRQRTNQDGTPKLSPDGRVTYSTGVQVARPDGGIDKGITIAAIEPSKFPLGAVVRADGDTWLTPYVQDNGGRPSTGQSIVCERLVAVAVAVAVAATANEVAQ